ncbi:PAS domain-containing protein [Sulfurivirga sp.]|uniref:PAS domain-containing protein n=1 Tax=Sulfurivirga sp. TaxID=2614236 RepID=UPI0025D76C08|nr:PAS domain-containing protein [Sulfurivirga sp.]
MDITLTKDADGRWRFPENLILVSKTDNRGTIKYANLPFCRIAGYEEAELVGQPHSIVRHPDMPKTVFRLLWETISHGHEFWGYVKNRSRDGGYYWVFAHVTPTFDATGRIIGYHSDRRAPRDEALEKVGALYAELRQAEQAGGLDAGLRLMKEKLAEFEGDYHAFVFSL